MFKLQNICVQHLGKKLLNDISLEVTAGNVLAVIGPNGSGKSTLLKTLSADLHPTSGLIQLDGKPLHQYSKKQLAQVRAVLPQSASLHFPFSVREIVEMGRVPHSGRSLNAEDKRIVAEAMAIVQIEHLKHRSITYLSGGERQRVQLARVLCQVLNSSNEKRYLLLDEPTSALDLSHQHQVLQIVRLLAEKYNVGVMIILHDLNLAALYADHIAVLKDGGISHYGAPDEILQATNIRDVFDISVDVAPHPSHDCQLIISNRNTATTSKHIQQSY
ncbi:heme ABC transporter ATP-binding protein [Leucothrix arctica]|uniref:Heme ABC transporter ATP-binding protein n=1 Tax=Leucothrix arctica TaxID=1481894 RepID=A0A317C9W9_9GAMM|nr:heme ABC transporter ATP-binding protein [Leucothrix arctica]PWQ95179.1 heme ABC transporter ATP-binding protein [Leucothrix arctica]